MSTQIAIGARQEAKLAQREARPDSVFHGKPAILRRGEVTAMTNGVHTVAVHGDDGNAAETYTGVRAFPDASCAVGQMVWLVFDTACGHPTILVTGGRGDGAITD